LQIANCQFMLVPKVRKSAIGNWQSAIIHS
jgi:hypothetical protein